MAYDEYLVERIRRILEERRANYYDKKIMGGRLFMVDDKMLSGVLTDKQSGSNLLMVRIGEEAYENEIEKEVCLPMDFTGRPMRGYIYITEDGFDSEDDLEYWIDLALAFNPLARSSKKKS